MKVLTLAPRGRPYKLVFEVHNLGVLGRGADCEVHLADSIVSRRHCKFYLTNDENGSTWMVEDLYSVNGTFINGIAVPAGKSLAIVPGDTLGVSDYIFDVNEYDEDFLEVMCLNCAA